MKRFLAIVTACCLVLGLGIPALAEAPEDMEAALQTAAARVKETLDIDDGYTEFSGNWNDGLRPGWYLGWSDPARNLSVNCDEDGLVTEMYRWVDAGRDSFYGFDAAFPAVDEAAARTQAEAWLERLTGPGETARIDGVQTTLTKAGEYRFYGRMLLNGLESPVSFSLRIGADGLMGYNRSDSYRPFVGPAPEGPVTTGSGEAAPLLAEAVTMELYYATAPGGEARLRYVPVGPYTVVDAMTGEAVDMDALYASFGGEAGPYGEEPMAEETMDAAAGKSGSRALTETELASIANYRDALDADALDAAVRALPHMGLEDFSLDRCSYRLDGADGSLRAELRYTAEMDEDHLFGFSRETLEDFMTWGDRPVVTKYITLDAKTGTMEELFTSYPLWEERGVLWDEDAAAEFLSAAAPERFPESELCTLTGQGQGEGMTFARVHEGYEFPENYLYVALEPGSGTVDEFRWSWDETASFAPSKGVVDEAAALRAYVDALDVTLGYVAWPEGIDYDDPVLYRYADWGYAFVESLRPAWYYGGTDRVTGVDALTGEPLTEAAEGSFVYDDLAGTARREEIQALGRVGVGFSGGKFRPGEVLTVKDAAILLLRAAGNDPEGWDDETVRTEAVWQGFFSPERWADTSPVTGGEFLRMLLGPSRYGPAAELEGIWAADYAGDGYAAVAAALGMDPAPAGTVTRADAAGMLYQFMSRP